MQHDLPTGLVTFLITDIEGSTEILQRLGDELFAESMQRHNDILRQTISKTGQVVHVTGDSFFAVFGDPVEALRAAVEAQRGLLGNRWPDGGEIRVRMGLHTGVGMLGLEDYVGLDVHRTARISAAGHGGQILVSSDTAQHVDGRLDGVVLRDLGPHRLKDLSNPERLYQAVVEGLPEEFQPIKGSARLFGQIPEIGTTFVGRSEQVAEVARVLSEHRLVTLTGPGGTGKTRLSMRVANETTGLFPDGTVFVDLESVRDEGLIATSVLKSLDRPAAGPGDSLETMESYLAPRQILMIFDNYEQLLPRVGVVSEILRTAPRVGLIVTSRAPLHLGLEYEYPVPPLGTPSNGSHDPEVIAGYESVQLFVERARSARRDFTLTHENAASVSELVKKLDGLPLAIELAASRVKLFTPREILDRLSNRLLASGAADVPTRQQTISNAVAWSYDLLDETAKRFFARMSVFMGDASLAAIEKVCDPDAGLGADFIEVLEHLVDHSLVDTVQSPFETRYQMLVVVREFAAEALSASGEENEIRDRHMRFYADLAAHAEPLLLTSHQRKWLDILAVEHDNVRAAHEWAISRGEPDIALNMTCSLWRFWQRRGHLVEGQMWAERSLAMTNWSPVARARGLEGLAGLLYWRGDWKAALDPYLEALDLMRAHGDSRQVANALYNASFPTGYTGSRDLARTQLEESLRISLESGDRLGVGRAYWGLCDLAFFHQDYEECIDLARRSETEFEAEDAPFDLGWARFMMAHASYLRGAHAEARKHVDSALPLFVDAGDVSALTLVMHVKAGIIEAGGDRLTAATLLGAIDVFVDLYGAGLGNVEENQYGALLALHESAEPEIITALQRGHALSEEEIIELAIGS